MSDKYAMNAEELENINSELFDSFDPEQELWIIGGSSTSTFKTTTSATLSGSSVDFCECDYSLDW